MCLIAWGSNSFREGPNILSIALTISLGRRLGIAGTSANCIRKIWWLPSDEGSPGNNLAVHVHHIASFVGCSLVVLRATNFLIF